MTTIADIVAAVVAALAVDWGDYDLSGTGAVQRGTFDLPPFGPFACVQPARLTGGEEQARGLIVVETHEIDIRIWVPYDTSTTTGRDAAAEVAITEAKARLDAARLGSGASATALGRCMACAVTRAEPSAAGATQADWASVELTLTTTHRRQR